MPGIAMNRFVEFGREFLRPMLSQPVVAGIAHNGQQPWPAVSAAEIIEEPQSTQVSLLHDVFSILVTTCQPQCQIECGGKVRKRVFLKALELVLAVGQLC